MFHDDYLVPVVSADIFDPTDFGSLQEIRTNTVLMYIPYLPKRWSHWHVSSRNSLRIRIKRRTVFRVS